MRRTIGTSGALFLVGLGVLALVSTRNAPVAAAPAAGAAVSGIKGVDTAPPVVVQTEPRAGATDVDPGLTEIKVTFSKDMQDGSWAFAQLSKQTFPQTTGKPHYEKDHRTCILPVKLEPGKAYVISMNKAPFDSFMDTRHRKAMEYLLVFETRK
jgi:RNA polymerase sigma-70 factor (ECF subfamily)